MDHSEHDELLSAARERGPAPRAAKILIVGGDAQERTDLTRLLNRQHRCTHVSRLVEAQTAISQQRYDLILLDSDLPDGDGLELARLAQQISPITKTIIITSADSFKVALRALRCGAADVIRRPIDTGEFMERVNSALSRSHAENDREKRIRRLQRICEELNTARSQISDQVDSLCSDLANAYKDLTEQMNDVALASEFRTLMRQELDVEDLLRTMLEFMLTRTGPTNAAVFLPDSLQQYNLGAYVNYDCPRDSIDALLERLCDSICPHLADESDIVAFDDAAEFADWIGIDSAFLVEAQVIAFACVHEGECLAVVMLFRSKQSPFDPKLAKTLDVMRTIFAEQLAQIIRIHHRLEPSWPNDSYEDDLDFDDDDDYGFGDYGGMAA